MGVLCKMNQIRKSDFPDHDDFLKAIRLPQNHEDEILDTPEVPATAGKERVPSAREILKPALERLAKEGSNSEPV